MTNGRDSAPCAKRRIEILVSLDLAPSAGLLALCNNGARPWLGGVDVVAALQVATVGEHEWFWWSAPGGLSVLDASYDAAWRVVRLVVCPLGENWQKVPPELHPYERCGAAMIGPEPCARLESLLRGAGFQIIDYSAPGKGWQCPRCDTWTSITESTCRKCGAP